VIVPIFCEKNCVFLKKNNVFFQKLVLVKNDIFFAEFFGENILKIIASVPDDRHEEGRAQEGGDQRRSRQGSAQGAEPSPQDQPRAATEPSEQRPISLLRP
jgi:hypothetical protein